MSSTVVDWIRGPRGRDPDLTAISAPGRTGMSYSPGLPSIVPPRTQARCCSESVSSCRRPGWVWMKLDLQMTLRRDHFITSNVDDIEPLA